MSIQKYAVPGPKAQAILARDKKHTSPSYPRDYAVRHGSRPGRRMLGRGRQPLH